MSHACPNCGYEIPEKGPRAMRLAMDMNVSRVTIRRQASISDMSFGMIARSRVILKRNPALAQKVLDGEVPLKAAYEEVRAR